MPSAHRHTPAVSSVARETADAVPIAAVGCFAGLAHEDLLELSDACRHVTFGPGDVVGGPAAGEAMVALVVAGCVRVSLPPDREGEVAFHDVPGGALFGHLEALADETPRISAVATAPATILMMPADVFRTTIERHPQIALHLMRDHARATLSDTPRAPAEPGASNQGLYAELLRLAEDDPSTPGHMVISRLPRHRELAEWTGLPEAEIAASLAGLVKTGCAERQYPGLTILDADKLRKMAEISPS